VPGCHCNWTLLNSDDSASTRTLRACDLWFEKCDSATSLHLFMFPLTCIITTSTAAERNVVYFCFWNVLTILFWNVKTFSANFRVWNENRAWLNDAIFLPVLQPLRWCYVVLFVWFTTNGMHAKNKNMCLWREQAMIEWSWNVNSFVACCHSAKL